jgi:putative DNA primase/helicase
LIKILTGQDKTTARFLFRESFEFSATFKLWLQGNHRPHIRSTGGAMWRRLLIVPFTKTVPEGERDRLLGEKLRSPRNGRGSWRGWSAAASNGSGMGSVRRIRYGRQSRNTDRPKIGSRRSLEEKTTSSEYGEVPAGKLYTEYKAWAELNGEKTNK